MATGMSASRPPRGGPQDLFYAAATTRDFPTIVRGEGVGGLAGDFAYIAKILLFVFLVLFVVSLIFGRRGDGPVV